MNARVALRTVSRQVTLGDVARLRSGHTPAKSNDAFWSGVVPWYTAKDLKTFRLVDSEDHISDQAVKSGAPLGRRGDLLILVRGMTLLKDVPVCVLDGSGSFNQDLKLITPAAMVSSDYLGYALAASKPRLKSMVTIAGHGTGRLDVNHLVSLPVWVPERRTQEWLTERFRLVDSVLRQNRNLRDLKRSYANGLAQQLLTGKKRFPEFRARPWPSAKLDSHVKPVQRKNTEGCTRVLTASGEHGLVDQREFFNRRVAAADVSGYYLLRRGEFAYNRSAMNGYPYGATKRLDAHDDGVLSTLYLCFAISDDKLDSDFLRHLFDSGLLNKQLRRIVRVGARAHGLLNVSDSDFFELSIPFPEMDEQRAIARLLDGLEREIELLNEQRDLYTRYKRGLMARLLSGEIKVPA